MTSNPYTQAVETKLYFIVFALFAGLMTIMIYRSSIDTAVSSDIDSARNAGILRPHIGAESELE